MALPQLVREEKIIERYGKVILNRYFLDPDGETRDFLLWGGKTDPVIIFATTHDKKVIAMRQFRRAANEELLEIAGGSMNKEEGARVAAQRELLQESGYAAKRVVVLPKVWIDPASCFTGMIPVIALGCTKVAGQELDETEKMEMSEPVLTDLEEWIKMIHSGYIHDSKTIALTFLALPYINE